MKELEFLIDELHNEYLNNDVCNNRKRIIESYKKLINFEIDWSKYSDDLYEKYQTLINSIDYHLNKWK